jgi:glycine/D-amino acid oxidase-like deaminating enzyme
MNVNDVSDAVAIPAEADAVVIGSGAFGLSAAYHLASMGWRRVVVLDRFEIGSQASPRAAGLFKSIQADELRARLAALSIQKVVSFERDTGVPLPVHRTGSLMAAGTDAHAEMLKKESEHARGWGVEFEFIDGRAAKQMAPALETDDLRIICHLPNDCYIEEPASLLDALQQAGERLNVTVRGNTPVTGIRIAGREVRGVVTTRGEIATPVVVDAAGAWARIVGDMSGAEVPVVPVRHQLGITEPVTGVDSGHSIVRFIDTATYVRPARGGLMVGIFESDPLPVDPRTQGPDFSTDDVPLDIAVIDRATASIERRMPSLVGMPLQEHRGGLFTMTVDGRFMVGPVPDVRGFWVATGCNGSGFSFAPALGQVLAEWMVDGQPSIDISAFSPTRFAGRWADEDSLQRAGVWQYANYYTLGEYQAE